MKVKNVGATFLVFWLVAVLVMLIQLKASQSPIPSPELTAELQRAHDQLQKLRQQNEQLVHAVQEIRNARSSILKDGKRAIDANDVPNIAQIGSAPRSLDGPSLEHEKIRRRVERGVDELWFYTRSKLRELSAQNPASKDVDIVLKNAQMQKNTIMHDLEILNNADGAKEWREKQSQVLTEVMQRRIKALQNPSDCKKAKQLVCNLNKGCGYGCQLHHVVYCFMVAFGQGRTMILQSKNWRYSPEGWEAVFKPISDTCTVENGPAEAWSNLNQLENVRVVSLPIVDALYPRPPHMPLSIPEDIFADVLRIHGDPPLWFVSQFIKYLLRPQPVLEQIINEEQQKLNFKRPIVGVHVRRTDKVNTEAAFHAVEEYMVHVDEYYDQLELSEKVPIRRVYLATDDPGVLADAKKKFPHYEFLSDQSISRSAGVGTRYSFESLKGVIMDIHFLAQTDFLVCTFSSQVCRVAYEIMQTLHADAYDRFRSLDDIYYFGGQNPHRVRAIYAHKAQTPLELDMEPGDLIGIAGNHWDGYSKGTNERTRKVGLFPSYKVVDHFNKVKYPTYDIFS